MWTTLQSELVSRLPHHGMNGTASKCATVTQAEKGDQGEWQKLRALQEYQEDWDGQGAQGLTANLVLSAVELATNMRLASIDAPTCVVPGVNGTIIFEWQGKDGAYLEVEVSEPYRAEACLIEARKPTEHWTLQ